MAKPTAVFYAQPGCGGCTAVKHLLADKGIDFEEKDILNDPLALEELERRGAWTAPVTLTIGEFVIKLNADQLRELLNPL